MTDTNKDATETAPPHAQLVQMTMAHWVSSTVYVAAKLNLADRLANGPMPVPTGKSGFEKMIGMPIFDWFAKNPEEASLFSETMIGIHGAEPAAVANAYDFSGMNTIVDVGGGTGNLLTTILEKSPKSRGILYDLPHASQDAPALIQARGLKDRVIVETGSFFDSVPAGGDAYLLSHIIHDWSEDQCLTILQNCRGAMNPDGRVLLIEMVLPEDNTPHPGKY